MTPHYNDYKLFTWHILLSAVTAMLTGEWNISPGRGGGMEVDCGRRRRNFIGWGILLLLEFMFKIFALFVKEIVECCSMI